MVLEIFIHVIPPSIEYSQPTTLPVSPLKERTPELELAHTTVSEVTMPPIDGASTKIVTLVEVSVKQTPLEIMTR